MIKPLVLRIQVTSSPIRRPTFRQRRRVVNSLEPVYRSGKTQSQKISHSGRKTNRTLPIYSIV